MTPTYGDLVTLWKEAGQEVDLLRARIRELEEVLRWYADEDRYSDHAFPEVMAEKAQHALDAEAL